MDQKDTPKDQKDTPKDQKDTPKEQKDTPTKKSILKDGFKEVTKSIGEQTEKSIDKISQKTEVLVDKNLDSTADKIGKTAAKSVNSFVGGVEKYNILTRLGKILAKAANVFIKGLFVGCLGKMILVMLILVAFFLLGAFLFKLIF